MSANSWKVCGRQKSTTVLPSMVIAQNLDEIDVQDVKMTTSMDEKGITRQYCVTWIDLEKNKKTSDEDDDREFVGLKMTSSMAKVLPDAATWIASNVLHMTDKN
ncbi:Protein CBG03528 [Caenorhabditis briggsae]|uniref:Protein CBG03528 n=1 Tax=Caenorhabditis briggsae TaxID=6238 RepID=A8WV97_CAEBR|nr:Protein CBG03528 [Caenorhabditis briggsae]CAP24408.2 Protein CBG03528 [Caenorhabditis briggsae]